jgi:hypothetical protein
MQVPRKLYCSLDLGGGVSSLCSVLVCTAKRQFFCCTFYFTLFVLPYLEEMTCYCYHTIQCVEY